MSRNKLKNKDVEAMFRSVGKAVPSDGLKDRILSEAKSIPIVVSEPVSAVRRFSVGYAALMAAFVLMLISAVLTWGFYGENYYEVYIDVNPSISLTVNRFGVVNKVTAINDDAQSCLDGTNIEGKSVEEAVTEIADALEKDGFLSDGATLYVSGYTGKSEKIENAVEALYYRLMDYTEESGYDVSVVSEEFSYEDAVGAAEYDVSPLKYKYMARLVSLDDSYDAAELASLKINEISIKCTETYDSLSADVIAAAEKADVSPLKYQLVSTLTELNVGDGFASLISLSTDALKDLYKDWVTDVREEIARQADNLGIDIEKYSIIYAITQRNSDYSVEELKDKTMVELKALDYTLEKLEALRNLID